MSAYDLTELYTVFGKDERRLCQTIDELAARHGDKVYQQLLARLFNRPFSSASASSYWHETMSLHPPTSNRFNHRAALLNYLFYHTDELVDPRVIEAKALKKLRHAAITDGLTGLYNQTYFKQQLKKLLATSKADAVGGFSLLLFDLDRFKQFNDRSGHLRGDRALEVVGRIIQAQLPKTAIAARYGGEEFAVLLPGTDQAEAIIQAEKIRAAIAQAPFDGEERLDSGNLTISGGVASYPRAGKTLVALIAHADSMLYNAKVTRNTISPAPADSRGIIRHALHNIVQLRNTDAGTYNNSLCNDISYTGLLLKTDLAPSVGKQIELRFPHPFWPHEHLTKGQVRHVRCNLTPNSYLVGIEFLDPQVDFIEKILPEDLYSAGSF